MKESIGLPGEDIQTTRCDDESAQIGLAAGGKPRQHVI
jgi:hypothetical protein